jgi:hypothetical protein
VFISDSLKARLLRPVVRSLAWLAFGGRRARLIVQNPDDREAFVDRRLVHPAKVHTIPGSGVDLTRFDPRKVTAARIQALRDLWGLGKPDGRTVFVLGGRITRLKGHKTIVDAAALLKTEGREDFLILFVGDDQGRTDYRQEVEDAISAGGLSDNIRLVGHCDDMPAAYRLADFALLPSTQPESFGRAAVEPQAMGRPVLVSDHGGARETVVEGETGWRLPVGDAKAWARGLAEAMSTNAGRRRAICRCLPHSVTFVLSKFQGASPCGDVHFKPVNTAQHFFEQAIRHFGACPNGFGRQFQFLGIRQSIRLSDQLRLVHFTRRPHQLDRHIIPCRNLIRGAIPIRTDIAIRPVYNEQRLCPIKISGNRVAARHVETDTVLAKKNEWQMRHMRRFLGIEE